MNSFIRNTAIVLLFFLPPEPLYAQNTFINPYGQFDQKFILEKDEISRQAIETELEDFLPQVKKEKKLYDPFFDARKALETRDEKNHNAVNREALHLFFNKPKVDEEKLIRQEWENAFGFDVWYPYYKAKEIESMVKKKLTVRIFRLKGEPLFERYRTLYVFKSNF